MADAFDEHSPGLESPATRLAAITPSDSQDLAFATRAVTVAQAGSVRLTTVGGDTGTLYLLAGVPFPIRVNRIWATGTTATGIVGLA